jgi:hypothetical protein
LADHSMLRVPTADAAPLLDAFLAAFPAASLTLRNDPAVPHIHILNRSSPCAASPVDLFLHPCIGGFPLFRRIPFFRGISFFRRMSAGCTSLGGCPSSGGFPFIRRMSNLPFLRRISRQCLLCGPRRQDLAAAADSKPDRAVGVQRSVRGDGPPDGTQAAGPSPQEAAAKAPRAALVPQLGPFGRQGALPPHGRLRDLCLSRPQCYT